MGSEKSYSDDEFNLLTLHLFQNSIPIYFTLSSILLI